MEPPNTYKEVQRLVGRLAALSRLIWRSGDRSLPFFKKIKQASKKPFEWDEECTKAFSELQDYLGSPELLTRPEGGEDLQLYLAVSKGAVSSVLVRDAEGTQKPIYYVSHVLHGLEESYPLIDTFVLAVVTTARKLKSYFEAHPIKVLPDQPIKRVLSNPSMSSRLTVWEVELSEFDIQYLPRGGMKAQALADFVLECTTRVPEAVSEPRDVDTSEIPSWKLYVDGASNEKGVGPRILIKGANGEVFEYALRFSFKATNNEAEYEAMDTGLEIAQALEIKRFLIPREKNEHADHLSRQAMTYFEDIAKGVHVEVRDNAIYVELQVRLVLEEVED
ncbi:hypothetical protein LIER_29103 [Lithospermum erythrorhizon]|uniref:Reverse transcriptase/retrotransposon-derived protein RNase H-like domain-containing protein n=1 Tax=Lithospermum erythrorhizon TaxID=34254 RepID=A0AAV3RI26_LITER